MPEDDEKDDVKTELMLSIQRTITEKNMKGGIPTGSLTYRNPVKAAQIMMLYSTGHTVTEMVKDYGLSRKTIQNVMVDYSDMTNQWRTLGGRLAARNYLAMSSLEEDLIDAVRVKLEADEIKIGFKDIKELSIAKAAASREALTARGEASSITEDRKVYSQKDYEDTLSKAKDRIEAAKQAQNVEVLDV
tara:strand:- start:4269 stop:4835 length:567 start_codon:yes stop_codon:yes gene_type:complete